MTGGEREKGERRSINRERQPSREENNRWKGGRAKWRRGSRKGREKGGNGVLDWKTERGR